MKTAFAGFVCTAAISVIKHSKRRVEQVRSHHYLRVNICDGHINLSCAIAQSLFYQWYEVKNLGFERYIYSRPQLYKINLL
ncbi:hypothetical protein [Nostoc sp.]|uniref:hypothetical protein n=1 Tax=Nostoc sp. TaxID=1180 RepID=UPI002FFBC64C